MALLSTAVGIVGAGSLVNLALTFAVIRRVRRQGEQLAARPLAPPSAAVLPAGTKVPDFAVRTITGDSRSLIDLAGSQSVIAFMSPRCRHCKAQLPEFRQYARSVPGGPAQVLVVILAPAGGTGATGEGIAPDLLRGLDGVASVAFEPGQGPAQAALAVSGFPSFYRLDAGGRVEAGGHTVRHVASVERV